MKYLKKPELHSISKASAILRNVALPFVFHTARFDAKDSATLRHMADAYMEKRAIRKNIAELHLDHKQAIGYSRGKFWATIWPETVIFQGIESNRMPRLTTLVLHEVVLVEVWIGCILKSQTLRRLHLKACVCYQWTKPLPSTKVIELVIQDAQYNRELETLVIFLAPQLEILEVHSTDWFSFPDKKPMLTVFPETCPRLQKYVLHLPMSGSGSFIAPLREFLIRTATIEDLELSVAFPSDTLPLPSSALPNLRLYDTNLSTGLPGVEFITGPRMLRVLRLRDDFVYRGSVRVFLQVPYDIAELHLALHQHEAVQLLALFNRGLPNIEKLHLDIRSNRPCSQSDQKVHGDNTPLSIILIWVSNVLDYVNPACPDNDNRSRKLSSHKLEKIDVDIDMDYIETTPHVFEKWFHCVVAAKCPALKEAYFRVWKVNNQGVREAEPRLWARWRMGIDEHWCYEGGYTSKHESPCITVIT